MKIQRILNVLFLFGIQLIGAQDYAGAIKKAQFLIDAHSMQTKMPGSQIAVMARGKLVWSKSFGFSDLAEGTQVGSRTKFRIASLSKPVTSLALGLLMDEGKIDIDKNSSAYLPVFPKKEYPITPRQLAASTSGIRHYATKDAEFSTQHYDNVIASLERFQDDPLAFEPGSNFLYSSYGWVLLSAVMEKASGIFFFELMETTWNALGMKNTTFDFPDVRVENKSKFYVYDKKQYRRLAPLENRSFMYAGGGYLSTAEDLVTMGQQLIETGFLSEKTQTELTQTYVLQNGTPTYYGLGWEVGTSRLNTPIIYHSGSLPTSVAHLVIYPKEEVVLAYLANTGDHVFFNTREAQSLAELFVEAANETTNTKLDVSGKWGIQTTSLRGKKTSGVLHIKKNSEGIISGTISFKRSRKKETYPIIVSKIETNKIHCIAVSPMFMDFYLQFKEDKFSGEWLHDFNVKGIPEKEEYWNSRKINGLKI